MSAGNLFEQQRRNRRRSAVLVAVFILFFAWIGFGADLILLLQFGNTVPFVGILGVLFGAGMARHAWKKGPQDVLKATGAWHVMDPGRPAEQQLVNVVEEMAIASGVPKPSVWVVPEPAPNAFATGTDVTKAHVAVTEGLLEVLNREELQSVVAHEVAHIRNHDVRLMTLLAAMVGALALIAEGTARFMGHGMGRSRGGGGGGGRGGGKGGGGALVILVAVIWLVSVILAPLISRLLALAVSRNREYLADATAAQFTRNPSALASALEKIHNAPHPSKAIKHHGTAHLCIADPLGRRVTHKQGLVADMFATHPPMAVRIARLRRMAYQYEQTGVLPETV